MNLLFNKKNLTTLGIFLLLTILIVYFGLRPLAQKTSSLYKSNKEKSAQLKNLQNEIVDLQNVQKTINEQKTKIDAVINYLPTNNETEFINQLETLANKSNNRLESFKFIESKTNKQVVNLNGIIEKQFEITVSGSYPSISYFVNGLNKLAQYNNVYNFSITTDNNKTKATISGAIYLRK